MENNYVCPYCGREIKENEVLFWEEVKTQYTDNIRGEFLRKHGIRVPAGNRFPRMYYRVTEDNVERVDENNYPTMLRDHLGNAMAPEELGTNKSGSNQLFDDDFDQDGFAGDAERRSERRDQEVHNIPKRACPFCHCDLPQQFGTLKTYHVAMFGGRAAGKTAYLINLFQQLNVQLSRNDLGSTNLASESQLFLNPMVEDYEREGTTAPTAADVGLMPIVCHYKNRNKEAFVIFYDIAGEGTGDAAYMANHKGIANCESLMLMIDPNMFVGGAFYQQYLANLPEGAGGSAGDCCRDPLDSFLYQAGVLCNEYSDRIKYITCVITKMDMLLEVDSKFFGTGDIELLEDIGDKHREAVNLNVLKRVENEMGVYLEKEHSIRLKEKIRDTFGDGVKINILGVSTATRVPGERNSIRFENRSGSVDPKHRIIEPFLVVLMYFGLIPAKNAKGAIVYFKDAEEPVAEEQETSSQENTEENNPPAAESESKARKKKRGLFGRRRK